MLCVLKLKMPGPNGVITVSRDVKRAEACLRRGSDIADAQMAVVELDEYKKTIDPSELLTTKKPSSESAFQSASDTKKLLVHVFDLSKPVNLAKGMEEIGMQAHPIPS